MMGILPPAAPGGGAAAPDIAALAGFVNQRGGTLFIIPAIDSYGFRRVMTALLGYLRDGTDREKAGAARAWYWADGLDTRTAEPDSLADLRAAWREALLREFVSNADLSVRRQAMSMLSLRAERYPAHLLPLVAEAARIGRAHPDESIRRATHSASSRGLEGVT
jgi:hypothetical protein